MDHISLRGQFLDLFKLRVGDYIVIYSFDRDERIVRIHLIDHRKDIYK